MPPEPNRQRELRLVKDRPAVSDNLTPTAGTTASVPVQPIRVHSGCHTVDTPKTVRPRQAARYARHAGFGGKL